MSTAVPIDLESDQPDRTPTELSVVEATQQSPDAYAVDATQGRQAGSAPFDDATQGKQIGFRPYDDATQAR